MNRKICTVFTCVALCTPLFASSLSDIVDKALDQSNAVASAQATLVANQIAVKELLVDDDPSYSISSGDVTFGNADGDTTDYSFDPSFTYNLNDDNDTSFNLISDMVIDDGEWEGSKVSFSAQTTFDFNPDDTSDDIQAALNLKEAEYQYNKALLTVKGQVLSYISTILSYSESLLDAQNTLRLYQEAYDNALATGAYVAEDTQAVTQMAQIKAEENIVNNYMRNINLTKQQFLSYTGFEYPEEIEAEDIELGIQAENSNSLIQIARYQTQVYEEDLRVLQQEDNQLTTEAGVASNIDADMSISGALAYEVNNLSVSGGLKTTYDWDDDTLYPAVTVGFTYTTDSTSTADDLEILSYKNKVQSSNLDYQDEVSDHATNIFSLQAEMQSSNLEKQQLELDTNANLLNLANKQALYDAGLLTESDLKDAQNACDLNVIQQKELQVNRLIIQNDIDKEFL